MRMALQGGEAMTRGAIQVIVVAYNSAEQIAGCLDALPAASDDYEIEVTVVDNGSGDDTLRVLHERHPCVHVIASANLGYAHGNNLGIRSALARMPESRAVLVLNPDSTLSAGSIDRLMETLLSSPDVGAVSPHIVLRDGQVCDRLRSMFGAPLGDGPLAGRDAVVSDRLHGCCMLVRPEVFRAAGFIDEDYFLYWEEMDFGLRAMAAGFRLLLCYDVLVEHGGDEPERRHRVYYMWRNQFRFAKRNFAYSRRALFLLRRIPALVRELAGFAAAGRMDLVKAAQAGLFAGLRGETGKSASRHASPPAQGGGA